MNKDQLKKEIIYFEGVKNKVYLDSVGLPTAGIGHLLVGKEKELKVGTPVPQSLIDSWFEQDLANALGVAKRAVGEDVFNNLDDVRQRVMVNLAFNLGNRLLDFKNTMAAVKRGDYQAAATGLENSLWYKQVGRRGPMTVQAMRTGAYPLLT